ncbi:MAG: entericidin A/B family lipoprotein, partial [Bacteroidales bacterium]|nr:entericidin A/B family lipoprotein [Bacteroidales bacterium]
NFPGIFSVHVLYKAGQWRSSRRPGDAVLQTNRIFHKRTHAMKSFTTSPSAKLLTLLAALVLGSFTLAGCNTIDGAGKDIERAGEEIQKATD